MQKNNNLIKKLFCIAIVLMMLVASLLAIVGCKNNDKVLENSQLEEDIEFARQRIESLEKDIKFARQRIESLEKERRDYYGISQETENAIIQQQFELLNSDDLQKQDIYIAEYIGVYDKIIALVIAWKSEYPQPPIINEIIIEDMKFYKNIKIWDGKNIYDLEAAYEQKIISKEVLVNIHNAHINWEDWKD